MSLFSRAHDILAAKAAKALDAAENPNEMLVAALKAQIATPPAAPELTSGS